eukprot:Pgem_evm1s7096
MFQFLFSTVSAVLPALIAGFNMSRFLLDGGDEFLKTKMGITSPSYILQTDPNVGGALIVLVRMISLMGLPVSLFALYT